MLTKILESQLFSKPRQARYLSPPSFYPLLFPVSATSTYTVYTIYSHSDNPPKQANKKKSGTHWSAFETDLMWFSYMKERMKFGVFIGRLTPPTPPQSISGVYLYQKNLKSHKSNISPNKYKNNTHLYPSISLIETPPLQSASPERLSVLPPRQLCTFPPSPFTLSSIHPSAP